VVGILPWELCRVDAFLSTAAFCTFLRGAASRSCESSLSSVRSIWTRLRLFWSRSASAMLDDLLVRVCWVKVNE